MLYPYAKFLLEFDRRHAGYIHSNSPANTKAAVLIEGRPLYFLPMVLKNVMFFLGRGWNLHIAYGEFAEPYLDALLADWNVNEIKLQGLTNVSRLERDALMKSSEFWKLFPEEKLLIFESNSVMCGSNVGEFLDYDFIGAPMGTADAFSFNGGFSLRSRRELDSVHRHRSRQWGAGGRVLHADDASDRRRNPGLRFGLSLRGGLGV